MISLQEYKASLTIVKNYLIYIAIGGFVCQIILNSSIENIVSNILALTTFLIATKTVFQPINKVMGRALTGTAVFLAITANSLAPVLGTLLEGHALTYTLVDPINTFFHRCLFAFGLLGAHFLVIWIFNSKKSNTLVAISSVVGANKFISPRGVWLLGFIGLIASVIKLFPLSDVIIKLLDGFNFLMWVPYLLLIPPYAQNKIKNTLWVSLLLLYLIQSGLSIAGNSRMGMVGPIATIIAGWLVSFLSGYATISKRVIKRLLYFSLGGILAIGILEDFSSAILIERAYRDTRTTSEQFQATINTFFDKKRIVDYQAEQTQIFEAVTSKTDWQENYIRNPFLARFVQIKFDDNCLQSVSTYSTNEREKLWESSKNKLYAQLPTPFLNFLNIDIDKDFVTSYSTGDMIAMLGGNGYLGGFRTGSIPAQAYALFGWSYIFVIIFIYSIVFFLFQMIFYLKKKDNFLQIHLSTLALLIAFKLYTDMSLDSVTNVISIIIRGIWQTLLIYGLSLWLVGKFIKLRKPHLLIETGNRGKRNTSLSLKKLRGY